MPVGALPAPAAARAAGEPEREAPGLAERRDAATTTAATSRSRAVRPHASSRATSTASTTSSPSSRSSSRGSRRRTGTGFGGTRSTGSASTPRSTSTVRSSASGRRRSRPSLAPRACVTSRSSARCSRPTRPRCPRSCVIAPSRTSSTSRSRTRSCGLRAGPLEPKGIATRLADDDYFRGPNGVAPTPATFLGNHDVGRAALKIKEQGGGDGAELLQSRPPRPRPALSPARRAGRLLRRRGRHDRARRRQGRRGRTCSRRRSRSGRPKPASARGRSARARRSTSTNHPVGAYLRTLGALRDAYPALSTGASFVRYAREGGLVVSRIDRERPPRVPRRIQRVATTPLSGDRADGDAELDLDSSC